MQRFHITKSLSLFFLILLSSLLAFGITGEISSKQDSYFAVYNPSNPPYTVAAKVTQPSEVHGPSSIILNAQNTSFVLGNLDDDSPASARWTIDNPTWGLLPSTWKATSLWKILISKDTPISDLSNSTIEVDLNGWKLLEANTSSYSENRFTLNPADYQTYTSKSSVVDLKHMMAIDVPAQIMKLQNRVDISVGPHTEWHMSYVLIYTEWLREPWTTLYLRASEPNPATSGLESQVYRGPNLILDPTGSSCTCTLHLESLQTRSSAWNRVGSTAWSKIPGPIFGLNGTTFATGANFTTSSEQSFAIETWVRPQNTSSFYSIIRQSFEHNDSTTFSLAIRDSVVEGILRTTSGIALLYSTEYTGTAAGAYSLVISPGYWYHIVLDWDGNYAKLYVNSLLVSSKPLNGRLIVTDARVSIGAYSPNGVFMFRGDIGYLRVYPHDLDELEVNSLMVQSTSSSYPVVEQPIVSGEELFFSLPIASDRTVLLKFWIDDTPRTPICVSAEPNGRCLPYDIVEEPSASRGSSRTVLYVLVGSLPARADWQSNETVIVASFLGLIIAMSALGAWTLGKLSLYFRARTYSIILLVGLLPRLLLVALTTNWDLQLYKGFVERALLYSPLPFFTLVGYGPLFEATILNAYPTYGALLVLFRTDNEFALNVLSRVPFIIGDLLLFYSTLSLCRVLGIDSRRAKIASILVWLNPLVIFISSLQPDALIAGLFVLSLVSLFQNRPGRAGVLLAISSSFKYWPLLVVPFILIYMRRTRSSGVPRFIVATLSTGLALLIPWAITGLILLGQGGTISDLVALVLNRLGWATPPPYQAAFTAWTLFAFPLKAGLISGTITFSLLQISILGSALFILTYAALGQATRTSLLTCISGFLLFLTSISIVNSPQFLLWPMVMLVVLFSFKSSRALELTWTMSLLALLVTLFIEPVSYLLLHQSAGLDMFVAQTAPVLSQYWTDVPLAYAAGWVYSLVCLTMASLLLLASIRQSNQGGRSQKSREVMYKLVSCVVLISSTWLLLGQGKLYLTPAALILAGGSALAGSLEWIFKNPRILSIQGVFLGALVIAARGWWPAVAFLVIPYLVMTALRAYDSLIAPIK